MNTKLMFSSETGEWDITAGYEKYDNGKDYVYYFKKPGQLNFL